MNRLKDSEKAFENTLGEIGDMQISEIPAEMIGQHRTEMGDDKAKKR